MTLNLEQLNRFHDYLCSQDYYKDFDDEFYLPEIQEKNADQQKDNDLKEIPLTFDNIESYKSIWEALFYLEAKAQIKKAEKEEKEATERFRLMDIENPKDSNPILVFHPIDTHKVNYFSSDIVIFSRESPEEEQVTYALGMVAISQPGKELKIKFRLDKNSKIKEANQFSDWFVTKICNIATLNREYQAIHSIGDLNLKELILNPRDAAPKYPQYFDIPDFLDLELKKRYNQSQYIAIKESLKKEGITLIQGPPGTGKTTTILGVLSVLLNSKNKIEKYSILPELKVGKSNDEANELQKKRLWRKAMPWLNADYEDWYKVSLIINIRQEERDHFNTSAPYKNGTVFLPPMQEETTVKPEKILICAPSNAAIDEIIRKMMDQGLINGNNTSFMPDIVRIGPNYHKSVQMYSLEYLQNKESEAHPEKDIEVIRNEILKKAKIICSTLSITGSNLLTSFYQRFDTVIIDEAGQAVEISTLIPMKYDCKRLILIGDPKQLPATVFSNKAQKKFYDRSLFLRFQLNGFPVHMLDTQYRMHPDISKFVSKNFYDSKLHNSDNILQLIGDPPFYKIPGFAPVTFFDIEGVEDFSGMSYRNEKEAAFVTYVYDFLKKKVANFDKAKFGIITPYNGQAETIRKYIADNDSTLNCTVEVNSVDGFQGREKDIIIISTVRAKGKDKKDYEKKSVGFVSDDKRMNVSLSRARVSLIIIGDLRRFMTGLNTGKWKGLLNQLIEEKRCFKVHPNYSEDNYFEKFMTDNSTLLVKSRLKKKKPEAGEGNEDGAGPSNGTELPNDGKIEVETE